MMEVNNIMISIIFSMAAISFYLFAAGWLTYRIAKPELTAKQIKTPFIAAGLAALLLHGLVLYKTVYTATGLNLGFYNALSLMSWVVALMVIFVAMFKPLENLAIVFLPAAALALLLEQIFPSNYILSDSTAIGVQFHILLSVTAYSLLAIAALQSILLAIQEHQIRTKHPISVMRLLPPMQIMEELLIQLLIIGFFLLSLSLATGMMFVHDIFAQHLVHKTVLSILAWFIFAVLLWFRWSLGLRGKKLIYWTLGGFFSLMLAYFGSKMVLELILHRV